MIVTTATVVAMALQLPTPEVCHNYCMLQLRQRPEGCGTYIKNTVLFISNISHFIISKFVNRFFVFILTSVVSFCCIGQ